MLQVSLNNVVLRIPRQHDNWCTLLDQSPNRKEDSMTFGINKQSPLNKLKYYHVVDYGLPPDPMHDLLEGYTKLLTKQLIAELVRQKHFSFDSLNTKIENFSYALNDAKPNNILSSDVELSGTNLSQTGKYMYKVLHTAIKG